MKIEFNDLMKRVEKLPDSYKEEIKEFIEEQLREYEREIEVEECYKNNHSYGPWEEQTVGEWAPEMAGTWFMRLDKFKTKNVYERKCTRCGLIETVFDTPEEVKMLSKKKDGK